VFSQDTCLGVQVMVIPGWAYFMLDRANCWTITRLQPTATTFNGDYSKVCGQRGELKAFARTLGRLHPRAATACDSAAPADSALVVP
jgi:hypothetical protein